MEEDVSLPNRSLLEDLQASFDDTKRYIETELSKGGMHLEARVKLAELQIRDLYWFVERLIRLQEQKIEKTE